MCARRSAAAGGPGFPGSSATARRAARRPRASRDPHGVALGRAPHGGPQVARGRDLHRRPSRPSRRSSKAARSNRVRPGSSSTRRSTSLSGRSSPRATEPKTRTSRAPLAAAAARISARRLNRRSRKGIVGRCGPGQVMGRSPAEHEHTAGPRLSRFKPGLRRRESVRLNPGIAGRHVLTAHATCLLHRLGDAATLPQHVSWHELAGMSLRA
jgi:hypothetical protein